MEEQRLMPLSFPLAGLDLAHEFDRQPMGTTRVGKNVRAYDGRQRGRGGSRPGLVKYLPDRVGDLDSVVQHLAWFTDPTHEALSYLREPTLLPPDFDEVLWQDILYDLPDFLLLFPEFTVDPSETWIVRVGGSGDPLPKPGTNPRKLLMIRPNDIGKPSGTKYTFANTEFSIVRGSLESGEGIILRLASPGAPADAPDGPYPIRASSPIVVGIVGPVTRNKYKIVLQTGKMTVGSNPLRFVQQATRHINATDADLPDYLPYFTPVTLAFPADVTAGDMLLVVFHRPVGGDLPTITDSLGNTYTPIDTTGSSMRSWYAVANSSGPCTVSVNILAYQKLSLAILEYGGLSATPLDTFAVLNTIGRSTGTLTVLGTGELAVAVFGKTGFTDEEWEWSAEATGYAIRSEINRLPALMVMDKLNVTPASTFIGPVAATSSPDDAEAANLKSFALSFLPVV